MSIFDLTIFTVINKIKDYVFENSRKNPKTVSKTVLNSNELLTQLQNDPEYKEHQYKFSNLTPPRKLYIDPNTFDIIIETKNAMEIIGLDNISIEYLDDLYDMYLKQNIKRLDNCDDPSLIEFINTSLTDEKCWNFWLSTCFWPESEGYKMFNKMEQDENLSGENLLNISWRNWVFTMGQALCNNTINVENIHPNIIDDIKKLSNFIITDIKKLTDNTGSSLVYVAKIKGKWYYIAIDQECLKNIISI